MIQSVRIDEDSVCCFRSISDNGMRVCWELHARCNLRCPHCMVYPPSRMPLDLHRMLEVVEEMLCVGVRKVLLSGGEPLLFSGLLPVCAKLAAGEILVDINTNLTIATRGSLQELRDVGVKELTVSLDGATAETYARCRSGGCLADVVQNIETACELGLEVDLTYVPTQLNFHELEQIADLAAQLGASSLTVAGLIPFQRGARNRAYLELDVPQLAMLSRHIDRLRRDSPLPIRTNRLVTCMPTVPCTAGTTICGIDASGYVHPCPLFILPSSSANDLLLSRFDEIVTDPGFAVNPEPTSGCPGCIHRSNCQGGCLGVKRILGIPIAHPDPVCEVTGS